jgi:ParB family chromosome partitioning protein
MTLLPTDGHFVHPHQNDRSKVRTDMISITDITVDAELEALLPALSQDELMGLIGSIGREGFTDPLIVWLGHGILVDGHNRLRIWNDNGADEDCAPDVREMAFKDRDAVKEWMLRRQLSRRNLTDAMRVQVALRLKPVLQAKAKANHEANGGDKTKAASQLVDTPVEKIRVDAEIAKAAGVSHETVRRVETVLEQAPEEVKQDMLAGKTSIAAAFKSVHVTNNSGNNEWYTPVDFLDAARSVLGEIDLDPASCELANTNVRAKQFYSVDDDGLSQEWSGKVWMNPPYGQPDIANFAVKLIEELTSKRVTEAIVLVNNATETEWGQSLLSGADAVCFKCGRIKFLNSAGVPANTPLQGQMFLYFGGNTRKFRTEFEKFGVCLK